jgi:hypothetical protein
MEISVAKATTKLEEGIKLYEKLIAEDNKNRETYQSDRDKAQKAYDLAYKKWEAEVKKIVLSNVKLANVSVNHSHYGKQIHVNVEVDSAKLTLPERPTQDTFYDAVKFKETAFPEKYDNRGYRANPSRVLYELKNTLEWLSCVEGTTISRVSDVKRLSIWL